MRNIEGCTIYQNSINVDLEDYVIIHAYLVRITDNEAVAIQDFAHNLGKTLFIGVRQAFTDEYVCVGPFTMLDCFKYTD